MKCPSCGSTFISNSPSVDLRAYVCRARACGRWAKLVDGELRPARTPPPAWTGGFVACDRPARRSGWGPEPSAFATPSPRCRLVTETVEYGCDLREVDAGVDERQPAYSPNLSPQLPTLGGMGEV